MVSTHPCSIARVFASASQVVIIGGRSDGTHFKVAISDCLCESTESWQLEADLRPIWMAST